MAGYCISADLTEVWDGTEITRALDDSEAGTIDSDLADGVIETASFELWSFVKPQYSGLDPSSIAIGDVPLGLRRKAAMLAAYYALLRRGKIVSALREASLGPDGRPEGSWADMVSKGEITLDASPTRLPKSTHQDASPVFRPKGTIQHYGELTPGDGDGNDDKPFNSVP